MRENDGPRLPARPAMSDEGIFCVGSFVVAPAVMFAALILGLVPDGASVGQAGFMYAVAAFVCTTLVYLWAVSDWEKKCAEIREEHRLSKQG